MNKQIIKMAKDLCHARDCHIKNEPTECYHGCKAWVYAERAVNKGYRKSTDVAREIFELIERKLIFIRDADTDDIRGVVTIKDITRIKKKYESEGVG